MRILLPVILLTLLCSACSADKDDGTRRSSTWFKTYQTDHTCQSIHPSHEDPFLRGPTGRAHPF